MMDKWSTRYSRPREGVRAADSALLDRIRNIALILLTVALLGVGITGGQAMAFRSDTENTFVNRMQTECSDALSQVNTLSRNGGSNSAALLGRIRASVHAMEVINEMNNSLHGGSGYLVPVETFTNLYAIIDSYSNKLTVGSVITEEQTNLAASLTALQEQLAALR
ncbi:MAG: hypothetical protein IJ438_07045 [Clostridia bacterium]|nr:hypothetical protein [Clostridia bacterium]